MTMHDERWTLGVAENGDVRLRDLKTGETWRYGGPRALFDALGKLADWREAPALIDHAFRSFHGEDRCAAIVGHLPDMIGCGRPEADHRNHYGVPDPTGAYADMCSQLPSCRDGEHSASCEVSIYRAQQRNADSDVEPKWDPIDDTDPRNYPKDSYPLKRSRGRSIRAGGTES